MTSDKKMTAAVRAWLKRMASAGGKARALALTPERRREIAILAQNARKTKGRKKKPATDPQPNLNA